MAALSVLETAGLAPAIVAADAAVKAAAVDAPCVWRISENRIVVVFVGTVADTTAALDAGRRSAEMVGEVYGGCILANPSGEVVELFFGVGSSGWREVSASGCSGGTRTSESSNAAAGSPKASSWTLKESPKEHLEAMHVARLRAIARKMNLGAATDLRALTKVRLVEMIRLAQNPHRSEDARIPGER